MKNVIIYTRVSTDEQAEKGYSLASQKEKLEKYCNAKGINILECFTDDYSAWKGFNRPAYNKLTDFIKKNKGKIDGLLFTQWSRFSRDTTESYGEIAKLKKQGIELNAIDQWLDMSVPENQYLMAFYLAAPQVENDRLSRRTKDGNHQALKQGRYLAKAPFGYVNNKTKKLLELDEKAVPLVKLAFQKASLGIQSMDEIRKELNKIGLPHCKQAFIDMLKNIMYAGKIHIKPYYNEPEMYIQSIHEPIISMELYEQVKRVLNGKKKSYKGLTQSIQTPLVGHLYCTKCNGKMTGSGSRGNGGVYHYYHCQRRYGCKNTIPAKQANEAFVNYLIEWIPSSEMIEAYRYMLKNTFKEGFIDREKEKIHLANEIAKIDERIQKATIKNLDGVLNDELFMNALKTFDTQKNELKLQLDALKSIVPEFEKHCQNSTLFVENIGGYYKTADSATQKKIIGSIFPEKIYFENNTYRTTKMNEVFTQIFATDKALNKNSRPNNGRLSSIAPASGLEPETL